MEGAFYYTYETVNFTKMKYYLGQHCTTDMNDGYFGSSAELHKDIKNGDEYEVNVIAHYKNIYDLGWAEFILIKERNAIREIDYYNESNSIYFNTTFEYGHSKEAIEKNRNTHLGKTHSKETIDKMIKTRTGINHPHKGHINTEEILVKLRKPRSEEGKKNMSEAQIGKKHPNKGWSKKKLEYINKLK